MLQLFSADIVSLSSLASDHDQAGSMLKKGRMRQFDAWYLGALPADGDPTKEKAAAGFRIIKARLQVRP